MRALYYTQRAVWRQDTSNSAKADITLSGAGSPLTPSFMPSCGASRRKASSNRFLPSVWNRCLEPLHSTLRIGRASTRTCGMEESSSHVCETKLGASIRRFILSWGNNGPGGNGVANTGGGGGGGWNAGGGNGGSGIVIVQYPYVANPPVAVAVT